MQIHTLAPPGNIHHRSFEPQAAALAEATYGLADDKHLLLAPHLFGGQAIPPEFILYNCEQIGAGYGANPAYIELMRKHEVWDYSPLNIAALKELGVTARYCPVGYSPCLTKPDIIEAQPVWQDIDVLFYGSINERRKAVLMELKDKCKLHVAFGVYGNELDSLIARSKIVLNMHYYETAIHEITRTSYLMANKKFIVSEIGRDLEIETPYEDGMILEKYENLASMALAYLKEPVLIRRDIAEIGFETFKKKSQRAYVEALLVGVAA